MQQPDIHDLRQSLGVSKHLRETAEKIIRTNPMDLSEPKIFIFADASPLTGDGPAHGGHMSALVNENARQTAPMGWSSRKLKRKCTRPPIHAKTFATIDAEAHGQSVRAIVKEVMRSNIDLHIITDSKSLVENIVSAKPMKNKKMNLDMAPLREDFDSGDFALHHVPAEIQLADVFTKKSGKTEVAQRILWDLLQHGKLPWRDFFSAKEKRTEVGGFQSSD